MILRSSRSGSALRFLVAFALGQLDTQSPPSSTLFLMCTCFSHGEFVYRIALDDVGVILSRFLGYRIGIGTDYRLD